MVGERGGYILWWGQKVSFHSLSSSSSFIAQRFSFRNLSSSPSQSYLLHAISPTKYHTAEEYQTAESILLASGSKITTSPLQKVLKIRGIPSRLTGLCFLLSPISTIMESQKTMDSYRPTCLLRDFRIPTITSGKPSSRICRA